MKLYNGQQDNDLQIRPVFMVQSFNHGGIMMRTWKYIKCIFSVFLWLALSACSGKEDSSWIKDLNYKAEEVHNIRISDIGNFPLVPVCINGKEIEVLFDTGNSSGFEVTNAIEEKVDLETVEGKKVTATFPDGSYRGEGRTVRIKALDIWEKEYTDVESTLTDWRMYGDIPCNGMLGLGYFRNQVITLDYKNAKMAVSDRPLDYNKISGNKYNVVPLLKPPERQKDLLYFEGEVNGQKSVIFLDTGSSQSFVDMEEEKTPGGEVKMKIGESEYKFKDVRQKEINRGVEFAYPVRFILGAERLRARQWVITIDKIENKLLIHRQ